ALPPDPRRRQDGPRRPADGDAQHPAAGSDHEGQRAGARERGRLLQDHRSGEGDRTGRELHGRHLADLADDAPKRARPARSRRAPLRAGQDQRDPSGDHRRGHVALGHQGLHRRGQGRRDPDRDAAREGAAGESRARAAGEGHRGRRRVPGIRAPQGRRQRHEREPDHHPAALPADDVGDVLRTNLEPDPPHPARALQAVLQQRQVQLSIETPPELRRDPVSGRWVVIAPARARRPGAARPDAKEPEDDVAGCPFCAGRESATPPETFAIGPPGRPADAPGWWVRVVPNKFPAFGPWSDEGDKTGLFARRAARGRQEVVVHSPRHARTFSDLTGREVEQVAEAWQNRVATAKAQGFPYVHALIHERRAARRSLAHSHSQLFWLEEEPPLVAQERAAQAAEGACVLCRVLADEAEQRIRIVDERDGLLLLCPFAGRQPYEMLIAPRECSQDPFEGPQLAAALRLLAEGIRRLHVAEGPVPLNAWLHAAGHLHLEVVPRLSVLAGLELGAGSSVNTLAPESAAGVLRGA